MPIIGNMLKTSSNKSAHNAVLERVLCCSTDDNEVSFVTEDVIKSGKYKTIITSVHGSRTEKGKEAVDIVYDFIDASGSVVTAKERHVVDGYIFERLYTYWIKSGLLPNGSTISDLVGICEELDVTYIRKGGLGSLQNRQPYTGSINGQTSTKGSFSTEKAEEMSDDDTEFDVFLTDDD